MGLVCFQFTHFPCDDWEKMYTLPYHHQIGSMNCVSNIKHILCYPLYNIWGWCVFSLPISLVMIERKCILCLIIIKSEVWTIIHCVGLFRSWNNGMRCISLYIFIIQTVNQDKSVINIPLKLVWSETERSGSSKGLKFIPTPMSVDSASSRCSSVPLSYETPHLFQLS